MALHFKLLGTVPNVDGIDFMDKYYEPFEVIELVDYLSDMVNESQIDTQKALDLLNDRNWEAIDKMREKGDHEANRKD